jgi:hypothetical protein
MITYLLHKLTSLPFFYSPEKKFASRFFDALGRIFIGDPRSLECGASFYYIQADRPVPSKQQINSAKVERYLIQTDVIRRRLVDHVAKSGAALIVAITVVWCIAFFVLQLVALGIVALAR